MTSSSIPFIFALKEEKHVSTQRCSSAWMPSASIYSSLPHRSDCLSRPSACLGVEMFGPCYLWKVSSPQKPRSVESSVSKTSQTRCWGCWAKMEATRCRSVSKISSEPTCKLVQNQAWLCPDTNVSKVAWGAIQPCGDEGLVYLMRKSVSVISFFFLCP